MKTLLFFLLFLPSVLMAQVTIVFEKDYLTHADTLLPSTIGITPWDRWDYDSKDCGTWEQDSILFSEWVIIDTINYDAAGDITWIYGDWKRVEYGWVNSVYCPCGCGDPIIEKQRRISGQGIIQEITKTITFRYVEKTLNEYEKAIINRIEP